MKIVVVQIQSACNYDSGSISNDGSCIYPELGYDCNFNCINDIGIMIIFICDENEISGCTNPTACNYNTSATDDDGSCIIPVLNYDCNFN